MSLYIVLHHRRKFSLLINLISNMRVVSLFMFQGVDVIQAYIPDAVWYEYETVSKCPGY